jgi:hypothetical protein
VIGAEALPPDIFSPSFIFNATGWLAMGAMILIALQRGWIITRSSHERELGIKDKQYEDMVALKDKAYSDMLEVKAEQISDQRSQVGDWKAAAAASDTRADLLAQNQQDLMSGIQMATKFIEGIYLRSGGGS